ncbi:ATP-binding protein [Mycobacterium sp. 21AC1]|uniref:ATP-binding protein n=1 Tax=[Mycobacterium] appelbergii TaxID=2939269 RepID=UPI00293923E3|nr:ATP-binding protein [Mycobacterium sp. 21AC1]MDV3128852.1 ATP-binding protein [Mycobacterium sp. 21AC1]
MKEAQPSSSAGFAKVDLAAPERAAQLRHEFTAWLRRHFALDPIKASDVVLAVNEALANAAEFAYVSAHRPGVMHMRADYDRDAATLTVTVADEGAWRATDHEVNNPARGRGIPLMRALTDRATIDPTPHGTHVRLQWDHIATVPGAAADAQN